VSACRKSPASAESRTSGKNKTLATYGIIRSDKAVSACADVDDPLNEVCAVCHG